jgi:hypothetical protein
MINVVCSWPHVVTSQPLKYAEWSVHSQPCHHLLYAHVNVICVLEVSMSSVMIIPKFSELWLVLPSNYHCSWIHLDLETFLMF